MLQSIFLKTAIYMKPNLDPQNLILICTQNMYVQPEEVLRILQKRGKKKC